MGETSRQLFVDCYIEGTTDFIFGPSTAVFQSCNDQGEIRFLHHGGQFYPGKNLVMYFLDCKIEAAPGVEKIYLGRPWRAHAKTVFIRCEMPVQVKPKAGITGESGKWKDCFVRRI